MLCWLGRRLGDLGLLVLGQKSGQDFGWNDLKSVIEHYFDVFTKWYAMV